MSRQISVIVVVLVMGIVGSSFAGTYGGGSGTAEYPYQIGTPEHLISLGQTPEDYDKCFVLTGDIDLSGYTFDRAVIAPDANDGNWQFDGTAFTGVFDGGGRRVLGLTIQGVDCLGLFGLVLAPAVISNVGVEAVDVCGTGGSIGGLCGTNGYEDSLGWSWWLQGGMISNCYVAGTVTGGSGAGGLVGVNFGSITGSYSTGAVTGDVYVGGLVANNAGGEITASYSIGVVMGNSEVGGLVGGGWSSGNITACFWDVQTSGQSGSSGGRGLTTEQMKTISIFQNAGWADKGWVMNDGIDYPHLSWENPEGVPIPLPQAIPLAGSGTAEDPYLVSTAHEFALLSWNVDVLNKQFRLTSNLDLIGLTIYPIGGELGPFIGVFDGKDHVISNAVISQPGNDYVGLFSRVGLGGQVRNLGLENVTITGLNDVGGLAGSNEDGSIAASYSTGTITGNRSGVGGLVGRNISRGIITASYSNGTIVGDYYVGGLVGVNGGNIISSYSTGEVTGDEEVGGLVGTNSYGGSITATYSIATVAGKYDVGGLAGHNREGSIIASYSVGMVIGDAFIGGFVGESDGSITSSFWDVQTSGQIYSEGGTGLTTVQMQQIETFLNAGWDFADEIDNGTCNFWQMPVSDYPRLNYRVGNTPVMPEGQGTTELPYLIRNAHDLGTVWFKPQAHYRLAAFVDMSGITWSMAPVPWFSGYFDGNGHVVGNLHIEGADYLGLFGQAVRGAVISNLGVEAMDISGTGSYIGGLVGYSSGCITASHSVGTVTGDDSVGGLVGGISGIGRIADSYSISRVTGDEEVGGLVGLSWGYITTSYSTGTVGGSSCVGGLVGNNRGSITRSHSASTVMGQGDYVGGLAGCSNGWANDTWAGDFHIASISSCYATGRISGSDAVGGFVGGNGGFSSIRNSYSIGEITGISRLGGLVGGNWDSITTCFWDIQTSGLTDGVGNENPDPTGVIGKTTAEMKFLSTFTDAGWDFTNETVNGTRDTWRMCVNGMDYPHLTWEFGPDFACPDGVFIEDLLYLSSRWLESSLEAFSSADRTGDGKVNLDDYALLAEQWMSGIELMPSLSYKVGECDTGSVLSAGNPLRFTVKVDGYLIDFEDLIFANCCIEKGICLEMRVEDRVITLTETELSEGICNCVCNYPTTARMGPFEPGTYTVQVDQIDYSGYITSIGQMEVVISPDE